MNAIKHELLTLEVESGLKTELERVCHNLGMNISGAAQDDVLVFAVYKESAIIPIAFKNDSTSYAILSSG